MYYKFIWKQINSIGLLFHNNILTKNVRFVDDFLRDSLPFFLFFFTANFRVIFFSGYALDHSGINMAAGNL